MKNHEQLIIDASNVIEKHMETHHKGFDMFFSDNVFSCSESCSGRNIEFFIRHFSALQAVDGLTGPQWLKLGKKAKKLQKEISS